MVLPRVFIDSHEKFENSSYHMMIKAIVQELAKLFGQNSGVFLDISNIIEDQKWKSAWLVLFKVAKVPVKFQWPCSDMWQPEKPRWSVYTEDFKCTLSEFQRYVEWKVDIVKNSCSKTRKRLQLRLIYHCICHRDSKWKFSHWCTSWRTGNEKPSNFMFSWINLRPYPKVKLDNE